MENLKILMDEAIVGFKLNHRDIDISKELSSIILDDIDSIIVGLPKQEDIIFYLSEFDNFFASSLRKKYQKFYNQNKSISKEVLNIVYNDYLSRLDKYNRFLFSKYYAIFKTESTINIIGHIRNDNLEQLSSLINNLKDDKNIKTMFYYISVAGNYKVDGIDVSVDDKGKIKVESDQVYYGSIKESSISNIKNHRILMYELPPILIQLLSKVDNQYKFINIFESIDRDLIIKTLSELFRQYINNIDVTEVFKNNGLRILGSTYEILTNTTSIKLLDSFSGKLLNGHIQISSDRGYKTKPNMPQQDAVLSIVKNENCYLNIIADGAGSSNKGENASLRLVKEIQSWFENLPNEILNNIVLTTELLKYKITQIDNLINQKYKNSYTTMVLALTIYDKTIIANIGDSTAYEYNKETDTLKLLTILDSDSKDLSYEDARYNPQNNIITAAIGSGCDDDLHINIINNHGQKIILSSDGVTDLVSEETFKSYFKENIIADKIIEDALSKKYTKWLTKTEDNISAIIVDLPCYPKKKIFTK